MAEYVQFDKLSALVVDDLGPMRNSIKLQLQTLGINVIHTSASADDALRKIEGTDYDLILCDYNLNHATSGQHFLEYLRQNGILKATTIFVMLTAEAAYDFVANAVEYIPDDYILKPCTETKLKSRLIRLADRRAYLMPVLQAFDRKDYALAVSKAQALLAENPDAWRMDVLNKMAQAQFLLEDYEGLRRTCSAALSVRDDVPWALLYLARANQAIGKIEEAQAAAKTIIEKKPAYVAAYELLAKIHGDAGEADAELGLLQKSSEILPSARRFRAISECASTSGDFDAAQKAAERAIRLSKDTLAENPNDYLALAQAMVDNNNAVGAMKLLENDAKKYGDTGIFGVSKSAILAQACVDFGDVEKAKKHLARAESLLGDRSDSNALTMIGKAMIKAGDVKAGLRMMERALQAGGEEQNRVMRRVAKVLSDAGHADKMEGFTEEGKQRIRDLVGEAARLMRATQFDQAREKVEQAIAIHEESIEALLAAAQLYLLWMKRENPATEKAELAKEYLRMLERLAPENEKVVNFIKFYKETTGESAL